MSVFDKLTKVVKDKGAGFIILIDPDRKNDKKLETLVENANRSDVDAIFVGGSLMMDGGYHDRVARIKDVAKIPVIFFPGGVGQINEYYDAMLFMSVISGRNPHYLIGEQVIAAPIVKDLALEAIPTGYMLLDGGSATTVEFMSGSLPIPLDRPDIAVAHALAGQYLGMKLLYLEAGSGAKYPVPVETIKQVASETNVSLIVGGGIRTPKAAAERVKAGASFIVAGTAIEKTSELMAEFSAAVHFRD
ncbi:MAG TPA: geranylgeranylglyceryl/heptaprenylglyceryl phosphate synthase [Candidatus Marinimicrobia bacterium]|nr:geranylgeranylglyceryl/heptaprenylglyceryl phosphate synthase [Candidatus Neomarinimicrobiota bacterium]